MKRPIRLSLAPIAFSAVALLLSACGGPSDVAGTEGALGLAAGAAARTAEANPEAAAKAAVSAGIQTAAEKAAADKLAAQKPDFDAALASGDPLKIDDLADAGNAWALFHRAQERLKSEDYMFQQGGFEDMEAASDLGVPGALMWVGERMAYGREGYKLQPNSGLKLMERAARAGDVPAMVAVAGMYAQDAYMRNPKKAREWYERAADKGSDAAKEALSQLDGG